MLESPGQQLSLTDPDARVMSTAARSKAIVGYKVQAAVDTKHHLIVAHEVTNVGHDRAQRANMALQAKEVISCDELAVVADRGYFSGEEILSCDQADITAYVPKTQTSNNQARGLFGKRDSIYHPDDNKYECPTGERLIYRFTNQEDGKTMHRYWSTGCSRGQLKEKCTTGRKRRVKRWEHEAVMKGMEDRVDRMPDCMRIRGSTVEHPFGTIKSWMGPVHLLMRRLEHVSTEMSLHILSYNLKRMLQIFGVGPLIAAIRGLESRYCAKNRRTEIANVRFSATKVGKQNINANKLTLVYVAVSAS